MSQGDDDAVSCFAVKCIKKLKRNKITKAELIERLVKHTSKEKMQPTNYEQA